MRRSSRSEPDCSGACRCGASRVGSPNSSHRRSSTSVASSDDKRNRTRGTLRDERLHQRAERRADVRAVRADVRSGDHDLGVMLGQRRRLAQQLVHGTTTVGAARHRGRAERAVLVAAVLDAQDRPDRGLTTVLGRRQRVKHRRVRAALPEECRYLSQVGAGHHSLHRRQRAQRRLACGQRGRAAHHHAAQARVPRRRPPHGLARVALRFGRHRARVEHRQVRVRDVVHHLVAGAQRQRAHPFAVVVIGATAERAEMNLHQTFDATAGAFPAASTGTTVAGGWTGSEM